MAAPIIDSVNPSVWQLLPGEQVDVTVIAHDPDSANGLVTFPVVDGTGNITSATIDLRIEDQLTFGPAEVPAGLSVSVQQISATGTSAVYRITA